MMSGDIDRFEQVVLCIWLVIAAFGILLNVIQIIWIVKKSKRLIDPFTISLAVVDLQTCCFNIPLEVLELSGGDNWLGSDTYVSCGFYWFFRYQRITCGSIIVCLISMCRYIAIAYPLKSAVSCRQKFNNRRLTILTWVITIAAVIPLSFLTVSQSSTNMISTTSENGTAVRLSCIQKQSGLSITVYSSVFFFVVPAAMMIGSHILLIRIFIHRKNNKLLAYYKGSGKLFRKSVINSTLILAYIPIVAPQGIYDAIQLQELTTPVTNITQGQLHIEMMLRVTATFIVISNPLVYSFLTPKFIKYVDRYSQWLREAIKGHKDLRVIWTSADWRHHRHQASSVRKFISDDKYDINDTNRHPSMSHPPAHPGYSPLTIQLSQPEQIVTSVHVENSDLPEADRLLEDDVPHAST